MVRRYLPAQTLRKPKQGFSVPLREWFRTSLDEMVGDYLVGGGARVPPEVFDRQAIQQLLAEHRSGGRKFAALREAERNHPIEEVGARLRGMMSWIAKDKKKASEPAPRPAEQAVNA